MADGRDLPALTSLAPGKSLDGYRKRVAQDLHENSAAILAHIGRRPVAFAYPFGTYGADRTNDPGIGQVLAEEVASRYAVAFHQDDQDTIPLVETSQPRVSLRRLAVGNWTGAALLQRIGRVAGPAPGADSGDSSGDGPIAESPPVVKALPPIPFLPTNSARRPCRSRRKRRSSHRRRRNGPVAPPRSTTTTTSPPPVPGPASPVPATVPTTESPPATSPSPSTTTTGPVATSTTTRPPRTTSTTVPPATTTTTAPCVRVNGKPCRR